MAVFFTLLGQVQQRVVFTPLLISKLASLLIVLGLLVANRSKLPSPSTNPLALLAGLLDVSGNAFYLLARHATRLDIAVVLSSLYPAATLLLARLILHERAARSQWLGAALCLTAVALIAL